ncbi:3-oxoacyl-[acyl-carrier-protein] reductase [Clostridium botulinum]|uniref:3-oxoacyl-[acyl-carrier-protein] reductase n=1 Tax=Clostridium botulinum (strain Langeland / NCTC 10281 / Type F) TaxID=441772 RepID=A7GJJ5_CLOBL|nr:3-oxoacyl-[acyl-carrier-protein] reductase [Clostridium botulinum]ABS40572.1 3-oxoacyl-[acyl-carrier-protein] reductase [Clostridium botulinum F str. Langeland]ADG01310.1 3-oxoacyl-[acyl-carrier-protein] reductase [Clostridium botulinum F str. 230613]KKM43943.1 3-ketoacyl-ACP reductase [Clostridium botulinum]MBY6794201.1 3-oxoacyl-[acyl-carrier-protein] reductase [Clostridium botulinum]MBY6939274.1 3-oxoacyl-[acyl-carrier-protein] reductase [Clostridium botulinum]
MKCLEGRTAIVTGASRGIGRAIAKKLASMGANLVLNYRSSAKEIDTLLEEIKEFGIETLVIQGDVSSFADSKKIADEAKNKFGTIDILINNAGITKDSLILRMTEEDFDKVISVNLKGVYNCSKHIAPIMLKQRSGKIINISSVVGVAGNAGQCNYAAAKAGVIGITKSLAKELGSRGITVNAVAPGYIRTDMTDALPERVKKSIEDLLPLKRLGTPEDVAETVGFLASDKAAYITGQVIHVDGGMII